MLFLSFRHYLFIFLIVTIFLVVIGGFNFFYPYSKCNSKNKFYQTTTSSIKTNEKVSGDRQWGSLTLNQQIAFLILALSDTSHTTSEREFVVNGDYYAMTGTIDNGDIYMKTANTVGKLGIVKVADIKSF